MASRIRDSSTWNNANQIQYPEIKKRCEDTATVQQCRSNKEKNKKNEYTNEGGAFRSAFIRAFTMAYRLTGNPYNDKSIVEAPEEMGPPKGFAGGHLPVVPEKRVSPQ